MRWPWHHISRESPLRVGKGVRWKKGELYYEEQKLPKVVLEINALRISPPFHRKIAASLFISGISPCLRGLGTAMLLCPTPLHPRIPKN